MKSSMDPLSEQKGRPYGGVGFLHNSKNEFVHNHIECKSDRICGINVYKDNGVILHIVGLYLPCYDGTKSSLDSYIETLDQVQCIIHNCSDDVPIILVGDMNTSLPREKKLPYKWFCQKPYSKRSAVLYDFLQDNNMCVANFMDKQVVHYTYQKRNTRSYIDHIQVPAHIAPLIKHCRILHRDADNVSDHLALSCNIGLETLIPQKEDDTNDNILKSVPKFPKPQWSVSGYIQRYEHHLRSSLESMDSLPYDSVPIDKADALNYVNKLYETLNNAIHKATTNCNEEFIKTKRSSGKAWWTKDCSRARDTNRLFFHIWKSVCCPKEGATYECYRDSKRSYRKVCRQAVQNGYRQKFNLIDKLHKEKRPSSMWNIIRQSKGNQMNQNSIDMNDLVSYYKTKFEAAPPNDFQNEAAKMVAQV